MPKLIKNAQVGQVVFLEKHEDKLKPAIMPFEVTDGKKNIPDLLDGKNKF